MTTFPALAETAEQTLIQQAQEGNRDAFGELVTQHYQGVINVVYRLSGDMALSEDAAQEAFIRAWEKLHTYRPIGTFRSWVYRIATNAALDVLRRQREELHLDQVELRDNGVGVEKAVADRQQAEVVREAVLSLPFASRSVLILREYEGFSYKEIAESLDIPVGTVMSRLNYARKVLKTTLADLLEVKV